MDLKRQCYFIYGNDTYRSYRALKAIEARFLSRQDSMVDFAKYDMEETSLETLKQTFLTIPFLATSRLFILKNTFSSPKSTQEGLIALLPQLSDTSVVVLYEAKPCDKRLSLYQWLIKQVKTQEYTTPEGNKLTAWINNLAQEQKVRLEPRANTQLATFFSQDTWRLALEIKKLANYVLSQQRDTITLTDVEALCSQVSEESLFRLSDAIRDANIKRTVELYRVFIEQEDPMLLAATIGGQVRTLAKVFLACRQGATRADEVAKLAKLNPYVAKLSLAHARTLTPSALKKSYDELIRFDENVKNGKVPPALGVLLLILRLHGTLKGAKSFS